MQRLLLFAILIELLLTAVHAQVKEPTYDAGTERERMMPIGDGKSKNPFSFTLIHDEIGPNTKELVAVLLKILEEDQEGQVRASAALRIICIARQLDSVADEAGPALLKALEKDEYAGVRFFAAMALPELGLDPRDSVPTLIKTLTEDEYVLVRGQAAAALGVIGRDASRAVPALINSLEEEDEADMRSCCASPFGGNMRSCYARALGGIGPEAREAVPALIKLLKEDTDEDVRITAINALGRIGPDANKAIPMLIEALEEDYVTDVRRAAADALPRIGPAVRDVIPALIEALEDDTASRVRDSAAVGLGNFAPDAKDVIPVLIQTLETEAEASVRDSAADAILRIAVNLQDKEDVSVLTLLRRASRALYEYPEQKTSLDRAIQALSAIKDLREAEERSTPWNNVKQAYAKSPYTFWVFSYLVLCLASWYVLLRVCPLRILQVNQWMRTHAAFRLPERFGGWDLSWRYAILVAFFEYHPRVLDAWIGKYVAKACENFRLLPSVAARSVHVPLPVNHDGRLESDFTAASLRDRLSRDAWCALVAGEGGSGKTSLAFQIARWGMAKERESRPSKHRMIPILVEQVPDAQTLSQAIHGQVVSLLELDEPVPDGLLDKLLRRRRLLVIVDHLSEMDDEARSKIRPADAGFAAKALIVTSRQEEEVSLTNVTKTVLRPIRIEGNQLSEFMGSYLSLREKRGLFKDPDYFRGCTQLSEMVGDRNVTVLIAKLFADRMIHVKEAGGDLPESIPDLMLEYINDVNRNQTEGQPDNRTVQADLRCIAWLSLRARLLPGPVDRNAVIKELDGEGKEERLAYLEKNLALIRTVGVDENRLRIALDPLAEYLAAMEYVDKYKRNTRHWDNLLKHAGEQPGAPHSIQGFLLALRDCCRATENNIPNDLIERIERLVGVNL